MLPLPYTPLAMAMAPSSILWLLGLIFFLLMVYSGYLNKLYSSTVTLCMTVFAALVSLAFFQPVAQVVMGVASWSERVAYGVVMMLLFAVTYIGCYALAAAKLPPRLEGLSKFVDGIGGALMGVLTGVVFSGFMLLALYTFPLVGYGGQKETFLGSDRTVVNLAAVLHRHIPWKEFEPNKFLNWAKTVNAPKKKRRAAEPEP